MTDIAAAVARVRAAKRCSITLSAVHGRREWVKIDQRDRDALCDFAAARLAEPPADLVEAIVAAWREYDPHNIDMTPDEAVDLAQRALTALAGRILAPGMVAVPWQAPEVETDDDGYTTLIWPGGIAITVLPSGKVVGTISPWSAETPAWSVETGRPLAKEAGDGE